MWKKYQTALAVRVCAFTAAKSRLEHDPEPKSRPSRNREPVSPRAKRIVFAEITLKQRGKIMIPIQSKAANPERDSGLRGLAEAFRLGVRPDMNWSFK
jgi:hypothetical protein